MASESVSPAESVPDGSVFLPHHLYVGFLLVALAALDVVARQRRVPWVVLGGAATALFGFALVWDPYEVIGAGLAGLGVLGAGVGVARVWTDARARTRLCAGLGVVIMADDVVEHSTGVSTPLDALWHWALLNWLRLLFGWLFGLV